MPAPVDATRPRPTWHRWFGRLPQRMRAPACPARPGGGGRARRAARHAPTPQHRNGTVYLMTDLCREEAPTAGQRARQTVGGREPPWLLGRRPRRQPGRDLERRQRTRARWRQGEAVAPDRRTAGGTRHCTPAALAGGLRADRTPAPRSPARLRAGATVAQRGAAARLRATGLVPRCPLSA